MQGKGKYQIVLRVSLNHVSFPYSVGGGGSQKPTYIGKEEQKRWGEVLKPNLTLYRRGMDVFCSGTIDI